MSTITESGEYYYAHGKAWLGNRTVGGAVDNFDISLPEIDALTISISKESVEHISKRSAIAFKDLKVTRMVMATGTLTCSQHTADMLSLYLFGTKSTVAGGTVTAEAFPSGIADGDIMPLPGDRTHLSTFTSIVDSTGSPITLTNGTNYEIDDRAGVVKFISVAGFVQPFKVTGVEAAGTGVGIMMQRTAPKWLRFHGINIADSDSDVVLDLYKIDVEPASEWQLLNDGADVSKYEIPFELLKDTTKASSATFGQYGRLRAD